ncbi:MAG TPA: hypothetical protein VFB70_19410 [Pyrinomonadaceae bacterium]|nr:hypothetical protein [Pyrinomonadaceae bacterium]
MTVITACSLGYVPGMKLKQVIAAASILALSIFTTPGAQDAQYRLAHANGEGSIKVGQEQFKVTGIVVKLLNDRTAELTLNSEITFFLSGTWSQNGESQEEFNLQITGGATPGGLDGTGKLTLGKDVNSKVQLILKGKSRTTKKAIEVYFHSK